MNHEDELMIAKIRDRAERCRRKNILTETSFLDMHQQAAAAQTVLGYSGVFYGGYPEAERRIAAFFPDYIDPDEYFGGEDDPLCIIRVHLPKISETPAHRDYLGSVLALGIERSVTGDIITREDGADIIVLKSISAFISDNYTAVRKTAVKTEILPVKELIMQKAEPVLKTDTVASLRLDSITASAFGISRSRAEEAIREGKVFVDSMEVLKPDRSVSEGARISLRGSGRAVLREIGGTTRKGRVTVSIERYK